MDITETKIVVAILIGLLRLISGLLPIKLYKYLKIWQLGDDGVKQVNKERQQRVECIMNMVQSFGGGVLFATCFLHMMPEVYHAVHELEIHYQHIQNYPFSQLIICIGFFMVYFVEELSQYLISEMPENTEQIFERIEEKFEKLPSATKNKIAPFLKTNATTPQPIDTNLDEKSVTSSSSTDSGLEKSNEELNVSALMPTSEKELIVQFEKSPKKILRCCLITLALSFHAIFEGIAIGLQQSVTNIWYITIAISIHSITLLFCVGLELLFSQKRTVVIFLFILVLSVTSPIGILIGLAVATRTSQDNVGTATASALLEGLSAGTLLYITFFEVLAREKERKSYRIKRGLCIISGFIIMACLQALE